MVPEQTPGDRIDADFETTFSTEAGQKVLRWLMDNTSMWGETSFDLDPYATAYNEGRRSVTLQILERVRRKWSPTEFADDITQARVDYSTTRPATDPSAS